MFACNFAPQGFLTCDGQTLPIAANSSLFALLNTIYGGDGETNFKLPNLAAAAAMHIGDGPGLTPRTIGEKAGEAFVTLTANQMPVHTHFPTASLPASSRNPVGDVWSSPGEVRPAPNFYATTLVAPVAMAKGVVLPAGGNMPHNNLMPYMGVTFCIAQSGVFPSRTEESK
jgi:microcystin-dependent protein